MWCGRIGEQCELKFGVLPILTESELASAKPFGASHRRSKFLRFGHRLAPNSIHGLESSGELLNLARDDARRTRIDVSVGA